MSLSHFKKSFEEWYGKEITGSWCVFLRVFSGDHFVEKFFNSREEAEQYVLHDLNTKYSARDNSYLSKDLRIPPCEYFILDRFCANTEHGDICLKEEDECMSVLFKDILENRIEDFYAN